MTPDSSPETLPGPADSGLPPVVCRFFAGLDSGFAGAILVLIWFAGTAAIAEGPWYARLNLAAGPFFGDAVYYSGAGWKTVAGIAHLVLVYSVLGGIFALIRPPFTLPALPSAVLFGIALYLAAGLWFWRWLHPFAPPYFPTAVVLPGHLLYSIALWRVDSRATTMARLLGSPKAQTDLAPPQPGPPSLPVPVDDVDFTPLPAEPILPEPPTLAGPVSDASPDEMSPAPEPVSGPEPAPDEAAGKEALRRKDGGEPPSSLE